MRKSGFGERQSARKRFWDRFYVENVPALRAKSLFLPPFFGIRAAAPQLRFKPKGPPRLMQRDGPSTLGRLPIVYLIVSNYVLEDIE